MVMMPRQERLFSTSFTSLTVYIVAFAGYMLSHKEINCAITDSQGKWVGVLYLVLEQGIYAQYGKLVGVLVLTLILTTAIVHRDEITWWPAREQARQNGGNLTTNKVQVDGTTLLSSEDHAI